MINRSALIVVLAVAAYASSTVARTWHVEKDGSGDFTVIYEALDAASAGDTIQIGAGRFEEYRREFDYTWPAYCCAHVTTANLTIRGLGTDVTFIGLESYDPQYPLFVIGISCNHNDLKVEDLTVQGVAEGIHFEGPRLDAQRCQLADCNIGVITWSGTSTLLQRCQFVGLHDEGLAGAHANNVSVIDCEFRDGVGATFSIVAVGGDGWDVRNTVVQNCTGGFQFESLATGIVEGCHVQQVGNGYGVAISVITGATMTLVDNVFDGDGLAGGFGTNGTVTTATNNVFLGGWWSSIEVAYSPMNFHGNHIINRGGMSVRALWPREGLDEPYDLDLTGNYWGTDDPAQIATWIDDYTDFDHHDLEHYVIVRFDPFEDQPVETQAQTWGSSRRLLHHPPI